MVDSINKKLNEMRIESTNSGGYYHFTRLKLNEGSTFIEKLRNYLSIIPAYSNPSIKLNGEKIIIENRNLKNLKITPIDNIEKSINNKLTYWKDHRTTLDNRNEPSNKYLAKEENFKIALFEFLNQLNNLKAYQLEGLDTSYAKELGGDHVGDELLFESDGGIFVLHFGWSS